MMQVKIDLDNLFSIDSENLNFLISRLLIEKAAREKSMKEGEK